jgi:hypothetical protein
MTPVRTKLLLIASAPVHVSATSRDCRSHKNQTAVRHKKAVRIDREAGTASATADAFLVFGMRIGEMYNIANLQTLGTTERHDVKFRSDGQGSTHPEYTRHVSPRLRAYFGTVSLRAALLLCFEGQEMKLGFNHLVMSALVRSGKLD